MPFTSACKHFGRRRGIFSENTRKKATVVSIQRELLLLIKSSPIHNHKQVLVTPCHLRNKIVKQNVAWWKSIVWHICVFVKNTAECWTSMCLTQMCAEWRIVLFYSSNMTHFVQALKHFGSCSFQKDKICVKQLCHLIF